MRQKNFTFKQKLWYAIIDLNGDIMKRQDFINNPALLLKEKAHIEQLNNYAVSDIEGFITSEEEKYHKQVDELVADFLAFGNKRVILLCGPTSAGKTTTSKIINQKLSEYGYNSITISLDNFLVPLNERAVLSDGSLDYDSFSTINTKQLNRFLKELLTNKEAEMPIYNFVKNRPEDYGQIVTIKDKTVIIMEGLHALNPDLLNYDDNQNFAYKIYIAPNVDFYLDNKIILEAKKLRLMRRCIRDYYNRGATIEQTLKTWDHTVASENLYIKPYKQTVDYIINSTHKYELMLYAKYLKPLLYTTENNEEIYELIKPLDACEQINKILIPDDSMLWEFINKN